jgi:hypothetical protein
VTTPPFGSVAAAIAAGAERVAIHDEMIRGVRMGTTWALHAHREWVPMEDHHWATTGWTEAGSPRKGTS